MGLHEHEHREDHRHRRDLPRRLLRRARHACHRVREQGALVGDQHRDRCVLSSGQRHPRQGRLPERRRDGLRQPLQESGPLHEVGGLRRPADFARRCSRSRLLVSCSLRVSPLRASAGHRKGAPASIARLPPTTTAGPSPERIPSPATSTMSSWPGLARPPWRGARGSWTRPAVSGSSSRLSDAACVIRGLVTVGSRLSAWATRPRTRLAHHPCHETTGDLPSRVSAQGRFYSGPPLPDPISRRGKECIPGRHQPIMRTIRRPRDLAVRTGVGARTVAPWHRSPTA